MVLRTVMQKFCKVLRRILQKFCMVGCLMLQKFCKVWWPKRAKFCTPWRPVPQKFCMVWRPVMQKFCKVWRPILQKLCTPRRSVLQKLCMPWYPVLQKFYMTSTAEEILQAKTSWMKEKKEEKKESFFPIKKEYMCVCVCVWAYKQWYVARTNQIVWSMYLAPMRASFLFFGLRGVQISTKLWEIRRERFIK